MKYILYVYARDLEEISRNEPNKGETQEREFKSKFKCTKNKKEQISY